MHGNSKLTPRVVERVGLSLRHGDYLETAAVLAGVTRQTLYNWLSRGQAEAELLEADPEADVNPAEALYLDFFDTTTHARAVAECRDVEIIARAGDLEDWIASAWLLERRRPEKYGPRRHST